MDNFSFKLIWKADDLYGLERALMDTDTTAHAKGLSDLWLPFFSDNDRLYASTYLRTILDALNVASLRLATVLQ